MVSLLYGVGIAVIAAGGFWIYAAFGGAPVGLTSGSSSVYLAVALRMALPGFGTMAAGVVILGLANGLATLKEILALMYRTSSRSDRS